ncbi:MAG: 3-deoxy-7-phosphoheptulonate synthase [Parachlamydiales bacterium]|nr:3-deoxy-7-phosphoheptulonate synthase [Verrucomicrobiota bacterium]MBX3719808.1 3-deoxy-7-phosphoheptulonate synthase [Candidatus Acheromyda pituitae]
MILLISPKAQPTDVQQLISRLEWMGLKANPVEREGQMSIAVVGGQDKTVDFSQFVSLPFVEKILPLNQPFKMASRQVKSEQTQIPIRGKIIGGKELAVMAGPCSIESEEQLFLIGKAVKENGAHFLRGGAFKPRTSPYSFQGLGEKGLQYLQRVGKELDLITVSEVMDGDQIELVAAYSDVLQIGARNMQNFTLLKKLGSVKNPILLKRGMSATYQDFLMSAEYIISAGNPNVILCERGIRTYETYSRNTLDLAAVPILRELSHLPIIVDPSHGTGIRKMVPPMARAAVAAGADGIMVEIHPDPDKAFSDAEQTLSLEQFQTMMEDLKKIAPIVDREII